MKSIERKWLEAWSKAATWDHFLDSRSRAKRKLELARIRYNQSLI